MHRALHAKLGQHFVHPNLAFTGNAELEVAFVVGITFLQAQRCRRFFAELRDMRAIIGAFARLVNDALAIGNFGGRIKIAIH